MDDTPWEPPLAGSEAEHLVGALERLRATFRWKVDDLDHDGLTFPLGVSALTLGGLLKPLAWAEALTFRTKLRGEPLGEPWDVRRTRRRDGSRRDPDALPVLRRLPDEFVASVS